MFLISEKESDRQVYKTLKTTVHQINLLDPSMVKHKLRGFDLNKQVRPIIIGANAKISKSTVPSNELLAFKLSLDQLLLIARNIAIRKELRHLPLKLNILGDSLCALKMFLYD